MSKKLLTEEKLKRRSTWLHLSCTLVAPTWTASEEEPSAATNDLTLAQSPSRWNGSEYIEKMHFTKNHWNKETKRLLYPKCQHASHKGRNSSSHLRKVYKKGKSGNIQNLQQKNVSSKMPNTATANVDFWQIGHMFAKNIFIPGGFHLFMVASFHPVYSQTKITFRICVECFQINIHLFSTSLLCEDDQVQKCARAVENYYLISLLKCSLAKHLMVWFREWMFT